MNCSEEAMNCLSPNWSWFFRRAHHSGSRRQRHRGRLGLLILAAVVTTLVLPRVATAQEDTTPPTLHALSCSPTAVDVTGGPQTVTCTATIKDDISGVNTANINFGSPSGQFTDGIFQPTSGDEYTASVTFFQFAESGTWRPLEFPAFRLVDQVGNTRLLSRADLIDMGFDVAVEVIANSPPDCSGVTATPSRLWPPNHKLRLVKLSGATDPDSDTVTLTITAVRQDEPLNGLGDGDTSLDARAAGSSDKVLVRAERSGKGNGRVYRIAYEVSDGKGGSCSGTVAVGVPKSMGRASVPVDSAPPSFDSFGP
jgi:hypothetical protein